MCRKDLQEWTQSASNVRDLVRVDLWTHIQRKFPQEVRNRSEDKTRQIIAESINIFNKHGVMNDVYRTSVLSNRIPGSPAPPPPTAPTTSRAAVAASNFAIPRPALANRPRPSRIPVPTRFYIKFKLTGWA
jgi:hypothetical protein